MRSLTVSLIVEDNVFFAQERTYEEYLKRIQQDKCMLYQIPERYRTVELCMIAISRTKYNYLWVPLNSLTPELIMHLYFNYIPLIDWLPDEFLVSSLFRKNSLQSYKEELLRGKTKKELLGHRLAWFREQGEKLAS